MKEQFTSYALAHVKRVLTQMDRDPGSPTYGCFDRNYWHYKIRDFPSSVLQQGIFVLEAMRRGRIASDVPQVVIEDWCVAALNALARQAGRKGEVAEYFPFERSYPAAAFGLHAAMLVLHDWQEDAPHLLGRIDWAPLRALALSLARREETEASNQRAVALAGLALAGRIEAMGLGPGIAESYAEGFFESQSEEGWFTEYGGPDCGYLSVTLDALVDYHDASGDERAMDACSRAVRFMASLVGPDGELPWTLNSRNTDYVVPYGLARLAAKDPVASWLLKTLFGNLHDPSHFAWSTDDRYHCHYIFASIVRSLPFLESLGVDEPPAETEWLWLERCGILRWRPEGARWAAYVGARKGGVLRIHREGAAPVLDHGWRIESGNRMWTTNWQSGDWSVDASDQRIQVIGRAAGVAFHQPSPLKHAALRLAAWFLGERMTRYLKKVMIFRGWGSPGPAYRRTVRFTSGGVQVADRFDPFPGATARPSPRQNMRHVASADSFSSEEWITPLFGDGDHGISDGLEEERSWTPNGAVDGSGDG